MLDPVPIIQPETEAIAEIGKLRYRELNSIRDRLGRMSKRRWDRWFAAAFLLLVGGVLGGMVGLIPFYSSDPTRKETIAYYVVLTLVGAVSLICGLAALAIKSERDDSVEGIKQDIDNLLAPYEKQVSLKS